MASELKSTIDLIMEKLDKDKEPISLTDEQRRAIAEIRKKYEAKIAEAKILLASDPNLPKEIARLEAERDREIQLVRQGKNTPS